jgi:serine/threonine-protein kinase
MKVENNISIGKKIADGGMARIHEAKDSNLDRTMVVKRLHPFLNKIASMRSRLIEEARTMAGLDHPSIVPVHQLTMGDNPFFTMKLIRGETLYDLIYQTKLEERTAKVLFQQLQIFLKVCDSVAFAHSRGSIHQDLKPNNVMVGEFGAVYVLDWGIARKKAWLLRAAKEFQESKNQKYFNEVYRRKRTPIGTPQYMAPEQIFGEQGGIDERTDVFLLGGILYEILTHSPPYQATTQKEFEDKALECKIDAPYERVKRTYLPPRLCNITMKALRRQKEDRYQSVLDLKEDVETYMQGGGQFERAHFNSKEVIIEEKDKCADKAYIICKGRCLAYRIIDGKMDVLREMGEGDVFGETEILSPDLRTASVEALEPVEVMVVNRDEFDEELRRGIWPGSFLKTLAERFKEKDKEVIKLRMEIEDLRTRPRKGEGATG